MRHLVRNAIIALVVVLIATWAVIPPDKKLRLGKDLAGGVSLIYQVDIKPTDPPGTLANVIQVLKERADPTGQLEIAITAQGNDRIEITMPLPNDRVKDLKREFERELEALASSALSRDEFSRLLASEPQARQAQFERLAAGSPDRLARFTAAAEAHDALAAARSSYETETRNVAGVRQELDRITAAQADPAEPNEVADILRTALDEAEIRLDDAAEDVARAEIAFEDTRRSAMVAGVTPAEARRALALADEEQPLKDQETGETVLLPSPRGRAVERLRTAHPDAVPALDRAIAAWDRFEAERSTLDDPADLIRVLKGAGVLNFRIGVVPGGVPDEADLRDRLKRLGPGNARSREARWFKINKVENWGDSVQDFRALEADPAGYFADRYRAVVEEYDGAYYLLLHDTRNARLTEADGAWSLAAAFQTPDDIGRPAIGFEMDARGARALDRLTGDHVGEQMAVLLDDEVYTAPTLQGRISKNGIITGVFTPPELNYIIRVLSAGSLQAKLFPEPISVSALSPELGADHLARGLRAGVIAFILCTGFLVTYYFSCGLVAVFALLLNVLLLVGAMSLNHAAFTLPGIAGIILTFGMAVDANVLIYERMREELLRGADLKTAVRLGYQRALSSIIDGNLTNLIVAVVLGFTGTQEIKGFAIALGIGVVTTIFTQLFVTRIIFAFLVERTGLWRHASMLPLAVPAVQRLFTFNVDWMRLRHPFLVVSGIAVLASVSLIAGQGRDALDNEFRGGTAVTVEFKNDADGNPITMTLQDVRDRVAVVAESSPALQDLRSADVIAVDPDDQNRSDTFRIKTVIDSPDLVQNALMTAFRDEIDSQLPLRFTGSDTARAADAPAFPVLTPVLGESIGRPDRTPVPEFVGGVAILLDRLGDELGRAPTLESLDQRLRALRTQPDYSGTLGRTQRTVVLDGDESAVRSAVLLVRDRDLGFFDDEGRWGTDVRAKEWTLAREALTTSSTLASVESFSPAIARTFTAQAAVAVLLSCVLIIIYVWVRFDSLRFSFAAIIATVHDCIVAIGFIILAEILYDTFPSIAGPLGILPFKIDLNVVASVLTILGYSLNDKIVVMDRIRENRGKLPDASRAVINTSVNQTMSRTIMTGTTTLMGLLVIYLLGGEGVRAFAYTLFIGIVVGTYSSVAIAAPMVWSRKAEQAHPTEGTLTPLPAA